MQHITNQSFVRRINGLPEVLTFSVTEPGWKPMHRFEEVSMELTPGTLACPTHGCKVYKYKDGDTHVVWHSISYGCPKGFRGGRPIR